MKSIAITGNLRTDIGTKFAKAARREGLVPCVVYGGKENYHFSAPSSEFKNLIYTPDLHLAEVNVDGKSIKCILKSYQAHPVTDAIQHVDFLELVEGKSVKVEIPIRFQGIAPGTKSGGKLIQNLRKLKIKTTPENLASEVFVDVTSLELGQSVKVKDVTLGEGMELLTSTGIPVASVEIPRALRSAQMAEGEEGKEGTAAVTE